MSRSLLLAPALLAAVLLSGCGLSTRYPPTYKYPLRKDVLVYGAVMAGQPTVLNSPGELDKSIEAALKKEKGTFHDPAKLTADERRSLRSALDDKFGTPLHPAVNVTGTGSLGVDDPAQLADGSELYRKHCMHCHGVAGDGRGPTAPWVHPHPRDYRTGLFKFISTSTDLNYRKPRRDDLTRVLMKGIDGTSMPTFNVLPRKEIDALVSYVMHLSIRGQTEFDAMSDVLAKGDKREGVDDKYIAGLVGEKATEVVTAWRESNDASPITPVAYPEKFTDPETGKKAMEESITAGYNLFIKDGACLTCHFDYGRQPTYRYDNWGTLVRPRDLTVPTYRGGRRPVDLYWRIQGGILGSGMPSSAHAKVPDPKDAKKLLYSPEAYWDLVHFVQALPYPSMLPENKDKKDGINVRKAIYGDAEKVLGKDEKWGKGGH